MQGKTTGASAEAQITHYTNELVSRRGRRRLLKETGSQDDYDAAKRHEWAAWNALDRAVKRIKPP
jgi:hypothetical protein